MALNETNTPTDCNGCYAAAPSTCSRCTQLKNNNTSPIARPTRIVNNPDEKTHKPNEVTSNGYNTART